MIFLLTKARIAAYYRANGRIVTQQQYTVSQGGNSGYQNRPEGQQLFYAYDGHVSVAALSNHQGKLKSRYQYDAFGEVLAGDLSDNPYAFTGQRLDPESRQYHFHFRKYDAEVGVWATVDPSGIIGGINLYQYVKNNPASRYDILGLWSSMGDGYGGDLGDSNEVQADEGGFHDTTPENTNDGGFDWDEDGNWERIPADADQKKNIFVAWLDNRIKKFFGLYHARELYAKCLNLETNKYSIIEVRYERYAPIPTSNVTTVNTFNQYKDNPHPAGAVFDIGKDSYDAYKHGAAGSFEQEKAKGGQQHCDKLN